MTGLGGFRRLVPGDDSVNVPSDPSNTGLLQPPLAVQPLSVQWLHDTNKPAYAWFYHTSAARMNYETARNVTDDTW